METLNPDLETCDRVSQVHNMISKEKMTLPQVLEALTAKVETTITMPKYLTEPPWRIKYEEIAIF